MTQTVKKAKKAAKKPQKKKTSTKPVKGVNLKLNGQVIGRVTGVSAGSFQATMDQPIEIFQHGYFVPENMTISMSCAVRTAQEQLNKKADTSEDSEFECGPGEVLCLECDSPMPLKRLQLIKKQICVDCMTEMEKEGRGTIRHRMENEYHGDGEEIDEVTSYLIRKEQ